MTKQTEALRQALEAADKEISNDTFYGMYHAITTYLLQPNNIPQAILQIPQEHSSNPTQTDIETLEVENRLLRARTERLERELGELAERVAKRLEQAGAGMQAGLIREVFITKSHP